MAIAHRPDAAEATRKLFDEHARAVLAICRVMVRDPDEAEDAAQQTFLAVHRSLLRGNVPRNPGAWVAAIARNECKARLRRNGAPPLPLDGEGVTESEDAPETAVAESLAELPRRQREAVVLRDVFGLSHDEIATALGVNVGAVNPLLTRARGRLRNRLRRVARGAPPVLVPSALRDQLAQLIPGFEASAGAAGGAGALGVAAKLASAPTAAKVAALVGVATVGATAPQLARDRPAPQPSPAPPAAVPAREAPRITRPERPAVVRHERRSHRESVEEHGRARTGGGGGHDSSGPGDAGGADAAGSSKAPAPMPDSNRGSGRAQPTATEPEHGGGGPGPSAPTPVADGGATSGPGGGGEATTVVTAAVETHSGPGGGGVDGGGGDTHGGTDGSGSGKDGSGG
jgi:RNA polymerase sigma-70 factor (ECF subfamily)